jgi:protein subunit release factor B
MATPGISPRKQKLLEERMHELDIQEKELVEKFIRCAGKGGQKINKTSSCVYLLHTPSGMEIKCQRDRSQALNRYYARQMLCEAIAEKRHGEKTARRQAQEKIKRQKRRRSRRAKEKTLEEKKKQGEKKAQRRPVRPE